MAHDVVAIIPARSGSKGIPHKNFRELAGVTPLARAVVCAWAAELPVVVSTDHPSWTYRQACVLRRPAALAQDDTPMHAVIQHVLEQIPGPPDQIVVLLQPTQPLRQPAHVTAAIDLLRASGADSVVSVVALPLTHSPDVVCRIVNGQLDGWNEGLNSAAIHQRQAARPAYMRDGTVYACWRRTVTTYHGLYGIDVRPLLIPASESCPLDTPEDWAEAERRLTTR